MLYINNWYVAGSSDSVTDKAVQVRMLGSDYVLFRDEHGQLACLSNVCPHRGSALARGECAGNGTVACPFHGWQFDRTGRCVRIPSQVDPVGDIPPGAKVDAYPVQEKYGLIWVFLGPDPESAAPIVEMPEYDNPEWRRVEHHDTWEANLHWSKMTDLDHVHLAVVHGIKLGGENPFRPGDHQVERFSGGWRTEVINRPTPLKGDWGKRRKTPTEVRSQLSFRLAGFTLRGQVSVMGAGEPFFNVFYEFSTPVDEHSTQMHYYFFRNFYMDAEHDADHLKRNLRNVYQDKANAESIMPKRAPGVRDWPPLKIDREDRMMQAYWQLLMEQRDAGNEIDRLALDASVQNGEYRVIPSPGRKSDPLGWVYAAVPLVPGGMPESRSARSA